MAQRRFWPFVSVFGLLLAGALSGCGGSNPLGRKAISGTVTLDGAPLPHGSINFQPLQGGGVPSGAAIADGKFSIPAEKGLPAGKYRVTINAAEPGTGGLDASGLPGEPGPPPRELIPAMYNTQSTLTADVGDNKSYAFTYKLKSK